MMNSGSVCSGKGISSEARQEQRGQHLVKGEEVVAARAAAEALVVGEHERDALGKALHDGVHVRVRGAQLIAAVALEQTVDEHKGAEIRAHPAVLPEALETGDRSGGDHLHHAREVIEPLGVIIKGVLNAAPFAPFGDTGLVIVAGALTADTVLGLPDGVEAFELFINSGYKLICCFHISLASLYLLDFQRLNKGLEAGAGWPTAPRAYSFSMVQVGMPSSFVKMWCARTFS